jgi:signal transduction histidine kinase
MEERAYALGGEVHVTSRPGLGTTIYVRVHAAAATAQEPAPTSACVGTPEPDAELTAMEGV